MVCIGGLIEHDSSFDYLSSKIAKMTSHPTWVAPFVFGNRLTEVDMNPSVIDQNIVHLEIGLFAIINLRLTEYKQS